jgi:hypothetical protein
MHFKLIEEVNKIIVQSFNSLMRKGVRVMVFNATYNNILVISWLWHGLKTKVCGKIDR